MLKVHFNFHQNRRDYPGHIDGIFRPINSPRFAFRKQYLTILPKVILTVITIEYSGALCSAGKTEFACQLMASTPGQYLFAVDRREVIETRIKRIEEKALAEGTYPVIQAIFSKSEGRFEGGTENVRQASAGAADQRHRYAPHVIVICTHEGLLSSDLSTYQGWTLIIDENPNIWTFGEIRRRTHVAGLSEVLRAGTG